MAAPNQLYLPPMDMQKNAWAGALWHALRFSTVLCVLIACALYQYGLGPGGAFYRSLARQAFNSGSKPWYAESVLHVSLAHLSGFDGSHLQMSLFVLAFAILTVAYVGVVTWQRLSEFWAYVIMALLFFHPLLMINFSWVLHPDAMTAFWTAFLFFSQRRGVVYVAGVFGALTHASQMLIISVTAIVCRALLERNYKVAIAIAAGWGAGKCVLILFLWYFGIEIEKNRLDIFVEFPLEKFVKIFLANPWWTLYSLHAACWPLLVTMLVYTACCAKRAFCALFSCQIAALVCGLLTYDTTRVHAVLSWGSLFYCLLYILLHLREHQITLKFFRILAVVTVAAAFIAPKRYKFHTIGDMRKSQQHFRNITRAP